MPCRLALASLFALAILAGGTTSAESADMSKTLRVAFAVAETGFDPQVTSDIYSSAIISAIVDPLYVYDYFARPVRMVPNTAAALPEVTDEGRTYTIKVKPGIYFAADPAFKGKRRELTAEDYVYSIKRIFDPKVRSYWVYVFEGNLVGLDDVLPAGAQERHARLRREDRGTAGARPLHAAHPVRAAELRLRVVAHDRVFRRGRARSRRRLQGQLQSGPGKSGGHGPLPAEELDARAAHRARGQSRLPRRHVSGARPGQHAGRRGDRQRTGRPQAAAGRQRRRQHHRGGAAATAVLRLRQSRLSRSPAVARVQRARRRRAQAPVREAWHRAAARTHAVDLDVLLQSRESGGRRLHAGEARVAARDQHGLRPRDRHRAVAERPGDPRQPAGPAAACTVTTRSTPRPTATIRAPRARCSTGSATRTATATASANCPTGRR